jgi:hypothetical protein
MASHFLSDCEAIATSVDGAKGPVQKPFASSWSGSNENRVRDLACAPTASSTPASRPVLPSCRPRSEQPVEAERYLKVCPWWCPTVWEPPRGVCCRSTGVQTCYTKGRALDPRRKEKRVKDLTFGPTGSRRGRFSSRRGTGRGWPRGGTVDS